MPLPSGAAYWPVVGDCCCMGLVVGADCCTVAGAGDQSAILPELSRRLTAAEEELSRVRELARKSPDRGVAAPLSDLADRLAHLRSGFDALA